MSMEMFLGLVVLGVVSVVVKAELKEISIWWKNEKKFNDKRRWS